MNQNSEILWLLQLLCNKPLRFNLAMVDGSKWFWWLLEIHGLNCLEFPIHKPLMKMYVGKAHFSNRRIPLYCSMCKLLSWLASLAYFTDNKKQYPLTRRIYMTPFISKEAFPIMCYNIQHRARRCLRMDTNRDQIWTPLQMGVTSYPHSFTLNNHDRTLKWKSQDITKANTMQGSKKFNMRWPCQKFRLSTRIIGAADADEAVAATPFDWFICSPATFNAVEPQISQILERKRKI